MATIDPDAVPSADEDELAQARAWAAEERARLIIDSVEEAIILLTPDGIVRSWNHGAERMLGYAASEIVGRHFSIFYPPAGVMAGSWQRELTDAAATGRFRDEGWRVRKDGSRFWASVVVTAVRDEDGTVTGFAKVTRDLTERQRAFEALRQSEERLRTMVHSVRDYAIFMLDPDGRVQSWNTGAERVKGYLPSEIIGQPLSVFYTPEAAAAGRPAMLLRKAVEQGSVEDEGWRVRKDGTRFWANVVITAMRNTAGELVGFTKVTRDLTERRNAEEALRASEHRLRLLIDSVADYAIFMLDRKGRVEAWNRGGLAMMGYAANEIAGKNVSALYTPDDVAAGKPARELQCAERDGRFEDDGWRVRKDGTRFWADVVVTAVRDETGALVGFAKVTRDLTERKRAEEERLHLAQAQEAIRLRDEFLAIASHELKTPLTSLRLQLQGVEQHMSGRDDKLAARLRRALASSERLGKLIDALLDVSRIASGQLTLSMQPTDLAVAAREVVEGFGEVASSAQSELVLTVDAVPVAAVDRLRVDQVLMSLLANAAKYAAGARIDVRVGLDGSEAVLEVADRGPGISEAELARVFGRFERAASIRHYGGLGLGLYVAREIVAAHGGSIAAENRQGGGARFIVRLPAMAQSR